MKPTREEIEAEIAELKQRIARLQRQLRMMPVEATKTQSYTVPYNPDVIVTFN